MKSSFIAGLCVVQPGWTPAQFNDRATDITQTGKMFLAAEIRHPDPNDVAR